MEISETNYPLRAIRITKNLSAAKVIEMGKAIDPDFPSDQEVLLNWERRGVRRNDRLTTLAKIYDLPLEVVASAAEPPT